MTKLSGVEKTSGEPLDILYAGSQSQMPFVKSVFFRADPSALDLGEHASAAVNRMAADNGCQLVAAIHPSTALRLLPEHGFFSPLWITTEANSCESPFGSRNHSLKKDLKLIRKLGLSCEESTAHDDFRFFWDRMYVPYTKSQHADQAILESEDEFARQVADGSLRLFFVVHDGRRVAGGALSTARSTPRFRYLGILDADPEARKLAVLPALYVYVIDWGNRNGHERVNLGGCRPFLTDGVLQFKKKFNVRLLRHSHKKVLYINPLSTSASVTAWLTAHPLIRTDGEALVATLFEDATHECHTPDTLWQFNGELLDGLARVERVPLT